MTNEHGDECRDTDPDKDWCTLCLSPVDECVCSECAICGNPSRFGELCQHCQNQQTAEWPTLPPSHNVGPVNFDWNKYLEEKGEI